MGPPISFSSPCCIFLQTVMGCVSGLAPPPPLALTPTGQGPQWGQDFHLMIKGRHLFPDLPRGRQRGGAGGFCWAVSSLGDLLLLLGLSKPFPGTAPHLSTQQGQGQRGSPCRRRRLAGPGPGLGPTRPLPASSPVPHCHLPLNGSCDNGIR